MHRRKGLTATIVGLISIALVVGAVMLQRERNPGALR